MKRLKTLLVAATLALGIQGSLQAAKKPTNRELKIGMAQEFENLNPLIMSMSATSYIDSMVGRHLTVIDKHGVRRTQLAVKLPTIENGLAKFITVKGEKKIEAQWEIKAKAKWGDGTPVTGHDVAFSREVALSKNVSVPESETYSKVEKIIVDAKNPKKFTAIYKANWDFNHHGTFGIIPKHLEGPVFKKFGGQPEGYSKNSLYSKDPTNPGLYCGPYRISKIALGSHVTIVPNNTFYGKAPKIQKIVFKLIPNTSTLEANLRSGNIDMISQLGLSLDQALAFEKKVSAEKLPYSVNFNQGLVYEHIDLNLDNPLLKDVNVRKALVHAVDRKKLTQALFAGKQKPAVHNLAPIDPWFTDDPKQIVHYKYSRRKAKKLLEKAGWKLGQDGYRYKNGKKLTFQIMTTSGNKLRELVEVFLQGEWKKVGIEITIKNEPPRVYFGETTSKRKFPAMAMYAWVSSPENSPKGQLHSKNIPSKANGFKGQNYPGYVNKKVDGLLDQLDRAFTANERKEIVAKVLYHYTNDVPVIPLYYRSEISVTPKNLTGYYQTGHQFGPGNHVEDWDLEKVLLSQD